VAQKSEPVVLTHYTISSFSRYEVCKNCKRKTLYRYGVASMNKKIIDGK